MLQWLRRMPVTAELAGFFPRPGIHVLMKQHVSFLPTHKDLVLRGDLVTER